MNIKELLQAGSLPAVDKPKNRGVKAHKSEFDLIAVLARQIRRLRKSGGASDMAMAPLNAPNTVTKSTKPEPPIKQDGSDPNQ